MTGNTLSVHQPQGRRLADAVGLSKLVAAGTRYVVPGHLLDDLGTEPSPDGSYSRPRSWIGRGGLGCTIENLLQLLERRSKIIVREQTSQARLAWERERASQGKYHWADIEIAAVGTDISPYEFKYHVLIAPIPRFFTKWRPEWGTPPPESLSRHVVAHQPRLQHFTEINSMLSIMLVCSILRDQQEWAVEVRASDQDYEE